MKLRFRRLWLTIHRWLGLTVGLLFVLLGLTGSVLVFEHAIDEWLHPHLLLSGGKGVKRSLSEVTANAEAAYAAAHPSESSTAAAVSSPRVPNGVWTAWFQSGTEAAPTWTMVYVDPYSGEVTGQRVWGENLLGIVYRLHYTLLGGEAGETVVGVGGFVMMISVASGISLWWPLWKNSWRSALAIRSGRRLVYDLHKVIGVITAPILLVVAFTGVYMIFPEYVVSVVSLFSKPTPPIDQLNSRRDNGEESITPEQAISIAKRLFPDATFDHFHPPQSADGTYEIGLRQPGEVQKSFGTTQVYLNRFSGSVLAVRDPSKRSAADTFIAWQFPLHNGEAFGLVGRWVVFISGLAPAALYVSGLILWLRRTSKPGTSSALDIYESGRRRTVSSLSRKRADRILWTGSST